MDRSRACCEGVQLGSLRHYARRFFQSRTRVLICVFSPSSRNGLRDGLFYSFELIVVVEVMSSEFNNCGFMASQCSNSMIGYQVDQIVTGLKQLGGFSKRSNIYFVFSPVCCVSGCW